MEIKISTKRNPFYRIRYDRKKNQLELERKEKGKFKPIASQIGKPIQFKEPISIKWISRERTVTFTPTGESDKVEIRFYLDRDRKYTLNVGKPLGRIELIDAR